MSRHALPPPIAYILLILLFIFSHPTSAAIFTVTNLNDSGIGSLRQAIIRLCHALITHAGINPAPFRYLLTALLLAISVSAAADIPTEWVFGSDDIWITDGTPEGTRVVKRVDSSIGSAPRSLTFLDKGKVLYNGEGTGAWNSVRALWITDGTPDGTNLITDSIDLLWLDSGAALGNGKLVFKSGFSGIGDELAVSDGTIAGTRLLKDINPVAGEGSDPYEITATGNGKAVFTAYHPSTIDREPWVTDGTEEGTMLLKDITPIDCRGTAGSKNFFTPLGNGKVVFRADDCVHGTEPWVTDGTPSGTQLLKDIAVGLDESIDTKPPVDSDPWFASLGDGRVVILAKEERLGYDSLYVSDGTPSGTEKIWTSDDTVSKSNFESFCRGKALFLKLTPNAAPSEELWVTNGTVAGTRKLAEMDSLGGGFGWRLACLGNGLAVFWGKDVAHGSEPWVTDGTPQGTKLIKDFWPGQQGSIGSGDVAERITSLGNGKALLFIRHPFAPGGENYITDGTEVGTKPLKDVNPTLNERWPAANSKLVPITFSESKLSIVITHYYQSILNRAPDSGGFAYWQGEAARASGLGLDIKDVFRVMAGLFFTSAEYLNRNTSDAQYITDLYRTFFKREPDSSGLAFWTQPLTAGLPRSVVLFSFLFSTEFDVAMQNLFGTTTARSETATVGDFYRGFLNRLPDDAGFAFWLGRFRVAQCTSAAAVGVEVESISSQFLASAEYTSRQRSDRDFVADLYYVFLRRGGDLIGFNYWVNQLSSSTRDQVRQAFVNASEFQTRVSQIIGQGCAP